MNSSLAERFSIVFLAGIHLVNSSLAERFSIVLSAGIHFGEFFLGREVFFCRDSYIASKSDFIKCGASLKPSSIKKPLGIKIEGRKEYTNDTYQLKYIFK